MAAPKPNGKIRICMDARWLNAVTRKNAYPQQNANRILGLIQAAKFVTTIDMTDAYFQVPLHPDSQAKTAFAVPTRGIFLLVGRSLNFVTRDCAIWAILLMKPASPWINLELTPL